MTVDQGSLRPPGYDENGVSLYYNQVRNPHPLSRKTNTGISLGIAKILRLGSVRDLQPTRKPGEKGLQSYIRTTLRESGPPLYIFDDHNHALFGWREAIEEKRIVRGGLLIHFDAHDDAWAAPPSLNPKVKDIRVDLFGPLPSLSETAELAHDLDIHQFIAPALEMGLISEVWWVDPRFEGVSSYQEYYNRENLWHIPLVRMGIDNVPGLLARRNSSPLLTLSDCDLDYFRIIQRRTPREQKGLEIMSQVMEQSGAITCATSPGFIGQQRAISLAKRLARI